MKIISLIKKTGFISGILFPLITHGQLAQNLTIGNAKALGLANAVTADPPGIDAIHFNPAGLTRLKGRKVNLKVVAGQFTISSELMRSAELEKDIDRLENNIPGLDLSDSVENGEAVAGTVSAMLPFFGLTELPVLLAPLGGFSISTPDNTLTFADAVYAPMIVGFTREEDSNARFEGNALGFTHLAYFTPSLGVRVTDTLSIGAGLIFSYTGVGMDLDMRLPHILLAGVEALAGSCGSGSSLAQNVIVNLCEGGIGPFDTIGNLYLEVEEGFNPSINIGVLWEPTEWFSWGAVYQSEAKAQLTGDFEFEYEQKWIDFFHGLNNDSTLVGYLSQAGLPIPQGVNSDKGTATLDFTIPAHFATGISVQLTPRFKTNIDIKWTDTAAWEEFKIEFDTQVDFLEILTLIAPEQVSANSIAFPRGYESTWSWAIGFEYQWDDRLALRAGYEDRPSAIPDDKADLLAPFGAAFLVGLGFSYQWDKDSLIDVGMGMLQSSVDIPSGSSSNLNSRDPKDIIYTPYSGYDAKTEITAYLFEFSYLTVF